MAEKIDRWQQVEGLDGPGQYIMATNPNDRTPSTVSLLSGVGRLTDNVEGLAPDFERGLADKLRVEFPNLSVIELLNSGRIKRVNLPQAPYLGGEFYGLGTEYYHYFAYENHHGCRKIELRDIGRPFFLDGSRYALKDNSRDGGLAGHMDSFYGKIGEAEQGFWRGRWVVTGTKPGKLVEATIRHVNDVVKELIIPLWKEVSFNQ